MDISKIKPYPDVKTLDQHPTKGSCSTCGWEGDLLDCLTEVESESWERPDIIYTTFFCPQCNEEVDNFY